MAPTALYYPPAVARELPHSSSSKGPVLVIGSLSTAQDGQYQSLIESLDQREVERQLIDRLVDGAISLIPNKFSAVHIVLASNDYDGLASQTSLLFSTLLASISPLGLLHISNPPSSQNITSDLTLAGFTVISNGDGAIIAQKPSFSPGASVSLKKVSPPTAVPLPRRNGDPGSKDSKKALWTFTAPATPPIDPESLLTPEDRARPAACSPVGASGVRRKKACKGCTCGLAELEEEERRSGTIVLLDGTEGGEAKEVTASERERLAAIAKTSVKATSSCGSCFLGDAFRCASCPYLGLPAFKPGEKVEIDFDSDDI
ncbi:cytokine-induced anti-apoptosis inhibitor 1, Fe-S biogenesis-domain-containing protein [Hysterangium stoloniferum]|nr:cytokine-induced anti-apoptosis inhibitor 1, Fe-S biogenesis-domain-containing protein [Hysterangium stoloniferum]